MHVAFAFLLSAKMELKRSAALENHVQGLQRIVVGYFRSLYQMLVVEAVSKVHSDGQVPNEEPRKREALEHKMGVHMVESFVENQQTC